MATKTEKNVQLKINKMTKNIFDQLSAQGLISEDELYLLSDDEIGPAKWGTIRGKLSNQTDLKIMLDSKADKSELGGIVTVVGDNGEIYNNLSAIHLTQYEYYQLMQLSELKPNCLYILDKDNYIDAFYKQIKNLSGPTDLSDAATKWYVDNAVSSQSIDPAVLSAYALSSDVDVRLSQKANKSEIPTVNNPTITFTQGNAVKGSITLNQANDQTIQLDAGGGGGGSGDYVPLSTDIAGNKTAATIGTRNNGVLYPNRPKPTYLSAIGANTFTVGTDCAALSANSFAQGLSSVAKGKNSIALGIQAIANYENTFVWSGCGTPYFQTNESVGPGTFNIFNNGVADDDVLFINGKKLSEIVGGGGGGDDIYCKYGSTSDDPPGLHFMTIYNGQTQIDYSQINNITNDSSKPSKIVGYFQITQADSQDYEIVVGTTGYDYNDNVSFVWKGNAGSNGSIKVPFIMTYNPMNSNQYIQVNGGWNEILMYITAIYNGGQMKGSFQ